MSSPSSALLRPAAIGLAVGMVLGALFLAAKASLMLWSGCTEEVTVEECNLELSIAAQMSKLFYFSSLGLILLGLGLLAGLRSKKTGQR